MDDATDIAVQLRSHAHPVGAAEPSDVVGDLEPVLDAIGDARVVGLGEATHGTREFFQLKHRVLQALVIESGVRLLGLEAYFAETLAIDDYVVRGEGGPVAALDGLSYDHLNTEAVLAMVEWLRAFNEGRPVEDRVRVYGIDAFAQRASASAMVDYLDRVDPDYLATVRAELATLERGLDPEDGDWDDPDDPDLEGRLDATASLVADLPERLADRESEYVEASSRREWRIARQHARVVERAHEGWTLRTREAVHEGVESHETGMVDTVAWVLDHEPHDRIVVWAHNLHIGRSEFDPEPFEHPAETMGSKLARAYGDDYYPLGFDFAHGSFRAAPADEDTDESRWFSVDAPPADSLAAELTALGPPVLFLDLVAATADADLAAWLAERPIHAIPGSYGASRDRTRTYDLTAEFDGLLFVEETGGTVLVERD